MNGHIMSQEQAFSQCGVQVKSGTSSMASSLLAITLPPPPKSLFLQPPLKLVSLYSHASLDWPSKQMANQSIVSAYPLSRDALWPKALDRLIQKNLLHALLLEKSDQKFKISKGIIKALCDGQVLYLPALSKPLVVCSSLYRTAQAKQSTVFGIFTIETSRAPLGELFPARLNTNMMHLPTHQGIDWPH